jgi:5-methylcytosine-specific restriction endonuclease McrA
MERTCKECLLALPESAFRRTGANNVLRRQCNDCVNRLTRERYSDRRDAAGLPRFVADLGRAEKVCTRCKASKPVVEFHKRRRKDGSVRGYTSCCKACEKKRTYGWRSKNPGGHARVQKAYRKRHPERVKAAIAAWLSENKDHVHAWKRESYKDPKVRARVRAATKRWAQANPELVCAYTKNYNHKKRSNGGAGLSAKQIMDLLSRPCSYCGGKATTLDHVIPVSRHGKHEPGNVVPACKSCNSSKGARTPEEWMEARRRDLRG